MHVSASAYAPSELLHWRINVHPFTDLARGNVGEKEIRIVTTEGYVYPTGASACLVNTSGIRSSNLLPPVTL